tara:strand:- start:2028 stop:2861 length:834 start_codon:yes stop_codon:yes gene_type:complete
MTKKFQDNVAIVTGGSEGIGFGIASALALQGAHVYLVARTKEKLEVAQEKIEQAGGKADIRPADITDIDSIKQIIDQIHDENRRLDIFVNNAGAWKYHSIDSNPEEIDEFRKLIRAPERITEYLVHKYHKNPDNPIQILNVISQAGLTFLQGNEAYGPGKMALAIQLLNLQGELDHHGIQHINLYGLYPATVATEKVLPFVKSGELKDPTTLESVVNTAIDLLSDDTPSRHAYVGYQKGKGIVRRYQNVNPKTFSLFGQVGEDEIVDPDFTPKDLIK